MKITHASADRLDAVLRQTTYLWIAAGVVVFCGLFAGIAYGNDVVSGSQAIRIGALGLTLAVPLIGYEKRDWITMDAVAGEFSVTTRQFWRKSTFKAPLERVAQIGLRNADRQEIQYYQVEFCDAQGRPVGYSRHVDPGRRVDLAVGDIQNWINAYRQKRELEIVAT